MRGLVWILCSALLLMPVTQAFAACCLSPSSMTMPAASAMEAEAPCHSGMSMPSQQAAAEPEHSAMDDSAAVSATDCPHGGYCAALTLLLPGLASQAPQIDLTAAAFAPPQLRPAAGWSLGLLRPPQAHS
nr:hypothetical protein [Oceanococcus sp. HetDA_MAG_MS8]